MNVVASWYELFRRQDVSTLHQYLPDLLLSYVKVEGWEYDWTIPKTLVFTISVMTTIGYGNITPKVSINTINVKTPVVGTFISLIPLDSTYIYSTDLPAIQADAWFTKNSLGEVPGTTPLIPHYDTNL